MRLFAALALLAWPALGLDLGALLGRKDPFALESYTFDPAVPLERRAYPCPPFLLEILKREEKRPDYAAYVPSAAERRVVARVFAGLPARMRLMLSRRLIGVYFVEGFSSNGLTSFAHDRDGRVHPYIIVNPAAFSRTLSDTLTARERSAFDGKTDLRFGWKDASGADYILVHEAAHAYDYVGRVTPCVGLQHSDIVDVDEQGKCMEKPWDAWRSWSETADADALPRRDRLKFYGLSGKPQLAAEDVPVMLKALETSPFASLYGAQNRPEDLAELVTFYHLTRKLGRPAVITAGGREYRPMRGEALERAARIYRELEGFPPATAERK